MLIFIEGLVLMSVTIALIVCAALLLEDYREERKVKK